MKTFTFLFAIILFTLSCKKENQVNNKIVLKVGEVEVTGYEIKKQLGDSIPKASKRVVNKSINDLIEKYSVIAEAYSKQYDTIEDIKKNIKHVSNLMMTQQFSYYWNAVVHPALLDSCKITPERLKKRSKLYYFNLITITDKSRFLKLTGGDSIINNITDFNNLIKKSKSEPFLQHEYKSLQWPFPEYSTHTDYLESMAKGQISELLNIDDVYYYFQLSDKEPVQVKEENKQKLYKELWYVQERIIDKAKDIEMIEKGSPQINQEAFEMIVKYINNGGNIYSYTINDTILEYNLNGVHKQINFQTFIEPLTYFPFSISITNEKELTKEIFQYYYDDYLSSECRVLGLYENEKFKLDQKNYKNNLLYTSFLEKEVSEIIIDSTEIIEYYNNNKKKYTQSKYMLTHCYFFESESDAMINWMVLSNFHKNNSLENVMDKNELSNLKYVLMNYKIDKSDTSIFLKKDLYKIVNLEPGFVSYSVNFNDDYALIYNIKEDGSYVQELTEVWESIKYDLINKKTQAAVDKLRKNLVNKHPVSLNKVDVSKL